MTDNTQPPTPDPTQPPQKPVRRKPTQMEEMAIRVLQAMRSKFSGNKRGHILLTGDPGIGKTSFIEILGCLIGIRPIIIEVPHITEEHLINIPFITFDPLTNRAMRQVSIEIPPGYQGTPTTLTGTIKEPEQQDPKFNVKLAKSNLFTKIEQINKIPDDQFLKYMNFNAPEYVQSIFIALGGTQTDIPDIIARVRQNCRVILFLDEFFRKATSETMRRLMRGFVDNQIGIHDIPNDVFIIMASNMNDIGLEPQKPNDFFSHVEFRPPTKDEWFSYFIAKYENNDLVKINSQVITTFKEALTDQDISFLYVNATKKGELTEVRTSPRRWEQLLLYINNSLPVASPEEGKTLLTNVKNNFLHYKTKEYSSLAEKVVPLVAQLINQSTPTIQANEYDTDKGKNWRESLEHLVNAQKRLGKYRKYVPVITGPPGIGKTSEAANIAGNSNMRLIRIDSTKISASDIIGIPLPYKKPGNDDYDVQFAKPKLLIIIENQIEKANKVWNDRNIAEEGSEKAKILWDRFQNQKWKYLIFFDELSSVEDDKTLNALRRVILEKTFGPADESGETEITLPEGSLVIAAMNPSGSHTTEIPDHFKDVVDIVEAVPSWEKFNTWIRARPIADVLPEARECAFNVFNATIDRFKTQDDTIEHDQQPFWLSLGGTTLYANPREYEDLIISVAESITRVEEQMMRDDTMTTDEAREMLNDQIGIAFKQELANILSRPKLDISELDKMKDWISSLPNTIFSNVLTRIPKHEETMEGTLNGYFTGEVPVTDMPNDERINALNDSSSHIQIKTGIRDILAANLTDSDSVNKFIFEENQPKVIVSGDQLTTDPSSNVSRLTNFTLALLFTLYMDPYFGKGGGGHGFDRLVTIGEGLGAAAGEIVRKLVSDHKIDPLAAKKMQKRTAILISEIHDLIDSLPPIAEK